MTEVAPEVTPEGRTLECVEELGEAQDKELGQVMSEEKARRSTEDVLVELA